MTEFAYIPLTEEEVWRNAGLGGVLDAAALGDPMAALLFRRLQSAATAMQPEIDRMKAEIEREWFEGSPGHADGLALLLSDEGAK